MKLLLLYYENHISKTRIGLFLEYKINLLQRTICKSIKIILNFGFYKRECTFHLPRLAHIS